MEGPQKKKDLPVGPGNPTPGYTPWRNNNTKRYTQAYVHSSIIHNSQGVATTQVVVDGWVDKEKMAYMHSEVLFSS